MGRVATINGRLYNSREHVAVASMAMFAIASGIVIITMITKQVQGRLIRTLPRMLSVLAVATIRLAVVSREFALPVERRSQSDETTTAILDFVSLPPLLFALLTTLPVMEPKPHRGEEKGAKSPESNQAYQPLEVEMASLGDRGTQDSNTDMLFSRIGIASPAVTKRLAIMAIFLVPTTLYITGAALSLQVDARDQSYTTNLNVLRAGIILLRRIPGDESMPWYKRWVFSGLFVILRKLCLYTLRKMEPLTMPDSRFQYKPIDLATDAIRLVRLIKGSDYDPIVCELFETFLHQVDGTPYEALSYTWGQPQELIEITLCGKRVAIRDNLFVALWHLRKPDEDRLLWIDAICIDQESHLEKGHQVGQMRLIYQNAQNVHIWLGKSTEDIDMLMTQMKQLDIRALRRPDYRRNSPLAWESEWPILREELDKLGTSHTFHERRCKATRDLLSRPWFRRVWIIQEVFSARVATVGCGWNTLPTRTFVLIPKLLGIDDTIDEHVQAVLEIMPGYLRQQSWHSQKPTLQALIKRFASCEATDSRDKIYALIGISSDAGSSGKFQPDYDVGVTMVNVIQRTISFLLFDDPCHAATGDLPTWDLQTLAANDLLQNLPKAVVDWAFKRGSSSHVVIRLLSWLKIAPKDLYLNDQPALLIMAGWGGLMSSWGDVARTLLANPLVDVNITAPDSMGTPLNRAVGSKNLDMVRLLVRHPDIDINHRNSEGKTPLWAAAEKATEPPSDNMVDLLLGHPKVDINYGGCAALRAAFDKGNHSTAAILFHDSRINHSHLREYYGTEWPTKLSAIPIAFGGYKSLEKAFNLLKKLGVAQVHEGVSSALMHVMSNRHTSIADVEVFLADVVKEPERLAILGASNPSQWGPTALHAAVENPLVGAEVVDLLLSGGVPIDNKDTVGRTALSIAVSLGKDSIVDLLLTRGADVEQKNDIGESPLWIASSSARHYLVEKLLKHGADVNTKNDLGQSALWTASCQGFTYTVAVLIEAGADIHEADHQRGWTPLFVAAFERREEVVILLLKAGADPANLRRQLGPFHPPGGPVHDIIAYVTKIAADMRGELTVTRHSGDLLRVSPSSRPREICNSNVGLTSGQSWAFSRPGVKGGSTKKRGHQKGL
ncbi:hypothetical protein V8F20_004959 [Naviculisporaceae sp. PSN 640]